MNHIQQNCNFPMYNNKEVCCCNNTLSPLNNIELGKITYINTQLSTEIPFIIIDGIQYFNSTKLCQAFNMEFDLSILPQGSYFIEETPNKIAIGEESIDLDTKEYYLNNIAISTLIMNKLYSLEKQTSGSTPQPVEPEPIVPEPIQPENPDDNTEEEGDN